MIKSFHFPDEDRDRQDWLTQLAKVAPLGGVVCLWFIVITQSSCWSFSLTLLPNTTSFSGYLASLSSN